MSSFYKKGNPGYRVRIAAARHTTFSDALILPAWSSGGSRVGAESGDGEETLAVIRGYIREFFGKFLRGERSPLLDRPAGEYGIAELQSSRSR